MLEKVVVFLIWFLLSEKVFAEQSYFTVIGPRAVQHGQDYTVSLKHLGDEESHIQLSLNVDDNKAEEVEKKNINLNYGNHKSLSFKLSDQEKVQNYVLTVTSGDFEQSVSINTIAKKYSILIQTDKPIYKPGDNVQYRILVLDSETKPYDYFNLNIKILDASNNEVHYSTYDKYEHENDHAFEGSFLIDENPFFGDWKIHVSVDADTVVTKKTFEVKEYILPRFEVFADTKAFVPFSDGFIVMTVSAKYNFGEFVKGKATIKAKVIDTKNSKVLKENTFYESNISETRKVTISLENQLGIKIVGRDLHVELEVEFEEELTKHKFSVTKTVTIHKEAKHILEIYRPKLKFKPGFPYEFTVYARLPDGSLETYKGDMKVKVEYLFSPEKCTMKSATGNRAFEDLLTNKLSNGKANFKLDVPQNTSAIALTVTYQETVRVVNILRFPSNTREYIQIKKVEKKNSSPVDKISINVNSSLEMTSIHYVVIGRTGVMESSSTDVAKHKEFQFSFKFKNWMIPEVQILVYHIHFTGEVVYDAETIRFDQDLPNQLKITPSPKFTQPRTPVKFTLESKPTSTVYLLAVDRSVNLLGTANEISRKSVLDDMEAYNAYKSFPPLEISGADDERYLGVGEQNTFIITNAYDGDVACFDQRSNQKISGNPDEEYGLKETPMDQFESKVRKDFPETWLFKKINVDGDGNSTFTEKLPDTITTWDISGFTLSKEHGLGIAKPQKIVTSQNFFVMVHLPYSIRVEEMLKIDVTAFNYFMNKKDPESIEVDVTLFKSLEKEEENCEEIEADEYEDEDDRNTRIDECEAKKAELLDDTPTLISNFDFYDGRKSAGKCQYTKINSQNNLQTKRITIRRGTGAIVSFYVKATKPGTATIRVRADIVGKSNKFDEVHRILRIKPEGITYYENIPRLIDLRTKDHDPYSASLKIPTEAVKNSVKIEAAVIGDLIGPGLDGASSLLRIPSGCYEQRMYYFHPNVAVMDYLNATKLLTTARRELGQKALVEGINKVMQTRHYDGPNKGAFSIWGRYRTEHVYGHGWAWTGVQGSLLDKDSSSIWFTAYILKLMGVAKDWISIDNVAIVDALKFLKSKQETDGKFTEYGTFSLSFLQSDSSQGLPLTAFTVIAFLENKDYKDNFKDTIKKSLDYIDEKSSSLVDNYALAISTYALALGGRHGNATDLLKTLEKSSFYDGNKNIRYWEKQLNANKGSTSASIKNEIASYAILAYVAVGKAVDAIPVVNWLVSQRNSGGGFSSTQDTVISLNALAAVAKELYFDQLNMEIKLKLENNENLVFNLQNSNRLKPQARSLPLNFRLVNMNAKGSGIASFQVSYSYNKNVNETINIFNLRVNEIAQTNPNVLKLQACASYIPEAGSTEVRTGMAIIEVELPSGYVVDTTFDLQSNPNVKKFELKHKKTLVILYYDNIGTAEVCPQVHAVREKIVDNLKSSPVKVYDYYKPEKRSVAYYSPNDQSC